MSTRLGQEEATRIVLDRLDADDVVVAALGTATFALYDVQDRPLNYYMWGGMGLAANIGLGLALARPERRVVVLDGDGALMMNLGALATAGRCGPANLCHVVLDNETYATTGGQPTGSGRVDLAVVAGALGYPETTVATTAAELTAAVNRFVAGPAAGPAFVQAKVAPMVVTGKPVPDPMFYRYRFLTAAAASMPEVRAVWRLPP